MFQNQFTSPVPASKTTEMDLLLKELLCLPLAIVQAAAFINNTGTTLEEYRSRFKVETLNAAKLCGQSCDDKLPGSSTDRSAIAATLTSLEHICSYHPSAAKQLFLMACVNPKDISLDVLGDPLSNEKKGIEQVLDAYALVTRRLADSSLDIHRLVHLTIRDWLRQKDLLGEWNQ
jgi:hypothetical protein